MKRNRTLLLRVVVTLIVLVSGWRILALGLAEHYVELALYGDSAAIDKALSWHASHPKALYLKATQVASDDPELAISLLHESIRQDPTNGNATTSLALLLFDAGDFKRGDILAEQAIKLMPSSVPVRMRIAEYWFKREQWNKTLQNWQAALITQPAKGEQIFPILLQNLESPESRGLLQELTAHPPPWWDQFFSYVVKHAKSAETVIALATMRQASKVKLSVSERKDLVWRLIKDQMWPEAFLVWVNSLSDEQKKYLGNIYNGSFELTDTNEGFDWHISKIKGVSVAFQPQAGAVGEKALHLRFENEEVRFRHIYQPLFLRKGVHEFLVNTKIDLLRGRGGLIWIITCAGNDKEVLGESENIKGASDWYTVSFKFAVPEGEQCQAQTLRLESTGKHNYDHKLEGDIWFDQVVIRSVR